MKDLDPKFITGSYIRGESVIRQLGKILGDSRCFICGGFAKWACSPQKKPAPAGDIDIYSETNEEFERVCSKLVSAGFSQKNESPAQRTFVDDRFKLFGKINLEIQVIKPIKQGSVVMVGTVQEILANFDFTVSRVAIRLDGTVIMDEKFEEHEKARLLVIRAIHCPISQVYRIAKYTRKGYFCSVREVLKLLTDWEQRDPDYKTTIAKILALEDPSKEDIDVLERFLHVD